MYFVMASQSGTGYCCAVRSTASRNGQPDNGKTFRTLSQTSEPAVQRCRLGHRTYYLRCVSALLAVGGGMGRRYHWRDWHSTEL